MTVKLRRGFDEQHLNAVECAKAAEAGGASAVAIHGRTRPQMYMGKADWNTIKEVVHAVHIPVFGNGDVTDGSSARQMLEETGCQAVMIGRGAQGNPWIFAQVNHYLETGEELPKPTRQEIIQMVLRHAQLQRQYKGENMGMREMRKHVAWYMAGFPGAAKVRGQVNCVTTFEELEKLLENLSL